MAQYITIKNFGPITLIEKMEVKDFMLFIGERATGKSTIAKLIYFFKDNIRSIIYNSFYEYFRLHQSGDILERLNNQIKSSFNELFPIITGSNRDFIIQYYFDEWEGRSLIITGRNVQFGDILQDINNESLTELNNILKTDIIDDQFLKIQQDFFLKILFKRIEDNYNPIPTYFIPAQRAILSANSYDKSSNGQIRDVIIEEYKYWVDELRIHNIHRNNEDVVDTQTFWQHYQDLILKGHILMTSDRRDFIVLSDGNNMLPLSLASSGQQESSWILILLQYLDLRKQRSFVVIEEPEANLDPLAQSLITEAIAFFSNRKYASKSNQVVITTHSPFILNTLNNILYASKLSKLFKDEVTSIGFAPDILLDFNMVAVYKCINGGVESIMQNGRIQNEEIDNISDKTLNTLDALIDLDLKYEAGN